MPDVVSSLTLKAISELSFCTVPLQQILCHLNHIHSFNSVGIGTRTDGRHIQILYFRFRF